MRYLAAFLLLCVTLPACAYDVELQWLKPTEYEDGTSLPAAEIARYNANCFNSSVNVNTTVPGGATELFNWLDAINDSGDYKCRMQTVAANSEISVWSNEVDLKLRGRPNPPNVTGAKKKNNP